MQRLYTQAEAAELLCLSERTLERLRTSGRGPRFVRIGKSIRYQPSALETFVASRVVASTCEGDRNGR
jgi:excisionase family DNA binding protein